MNNNSLELIAKDTAIEIQYQNYLHNRDSVWWCASHVVYGCDHGLDYSVCCNCAI